MFLYNWKLTYFNNFSIVTNLQGPTNSTMENYDTLIDVSLDGSYCILFLNKHLLTRREIEEIFSQFGNIHNLKFVGSEEKHWFVRYKLLNEAKRAVDNLKNHPKIKLSTHNRKLRDLSNSKRNQCSEQGEKECNGTTFIQQFSRQNNGKNDRSGYGRNGNNKENGYIGNVNNMAPGSKSPNGNWEQHDVPWGPKCPKEYQKQNGISKTQRSPKQNDQVKRLNSPNQRNCDRLPDLVDRNRKTMVEIQNQEDEIPELVTSSGKALRKNSPIKIVLAQEVIVANIHPKFGSPYILHLFDRFEPLAITNIKVAPKTGKRYCQVYFKSVGEAQKVESLFDKKFLFDQRLVVIQSGRLVESAYFNV